MFRRVLASVLAAIIFLSPFNNVTFAQNENSTANTLRSSSPTQSNTTDTNVSKFDGSFSYHFPIAIPPGRNQLQPNLALSYNSNNRDADNLYGHGWSLNIPYIVRLNKTGSNNLYSQNYYHSSIDGELVNTSGNEYRPRADNGSNHVYTLSSNVWTYTEKNGTTHTFGSTAGSRQDNPSNASQIYKWLIDTTEDTNSNPINYSYFKDDGAIYPDTVSQSNSFSVEFNRTTRSAASTTYPGFFVKAGYEINNITVEFDGSTVREYDLNKTDRRLTSITETGYDGATSTTLPDHTFTYAHDTASTTWSYDSSFTGALDNAFYAGTRFGDVNGDGLPDAVVSYYNTSWGPDHQRHVRLNTGDGWSLSSGGWSVPDDVDTVFWNQNQGKPGGGHLVDINGDGLVDIVATDEATDNLEFYINTGSNWAYDSSWNKAITLQFEHAYRFADVNGDGLLDLLLAWVDGSNFQKQVCLNTGTSISTSCGQFSFPNDDELAFWYHSSQEPGKGGLADVNGDGLVDLYKFTNATPSDIVEFYINNGSGWEHDDQWDTLLPHAFAQGTRFFDINGDGLNDLVTSYYNTSWGPDHQRHVRLNTGAGWSNGGMSIPLDDSLAFWDANAGEPYHGSIIDVNGDGLADFVKIGSEDKIKTYLNLSIPKGKITSVATPNGGTTTITYAAAGISDSSNKGQVPLQVVDTVVRNDGFGTTGTSSYVYKEADYWHGSHLDRRFAGFGEVIKTDEVGTVETHKFHQGNGTTTDELVDSYARMGQPYEKTLKESSNNLYTHERYTYTDTTIGTGATSSLLTSYLKQDYDGDTDHKDSAVTYTYDTTNGSILTQVEYGEVSGATDGTFTDTGTDKRTTTYTYATNTAGLVLPATVTLTNNASAKINETKLYYDNQALGSVTYGNLTKEATWITGSDYAETTNAYNSYGLVTSTTDPNGNTTNFSYDPYNLFPATTTNALSQSTYREYDYSSSQVTKEVDANGNVFENEYDGLDRLTAEYIPDPQTGAKVQKTAIAYTDTKGAVATFRNDYLSSTNLVGTHTYFDGFGRPIQTRSEAESGYIVTDTIYGADGLVVKESLPYADTGAARTSATTDTDLLTEYSYDALKRVTEAETTLGSTLTSYDQWTETVTDALSNTKGFTRDAFGRLVAIDEHNGASTYTTNYDWRADDLLVAIADADDNERAITYDGRGLRTNLEDLHNPSDSTFGEWSFTYDAAGNLATTTDPKSQVVVTSYDALNRPVSENYLGQAGTEIEYGYDSCTEGVGRLCSATTSDAATNYAYTPTDQPPISIPVSI